MRAREQPGYRSLFGIRDYRLLFTGLLASQIGSWAYNVGLIVYVFNVTHSAGWVAAASMVRFLTALVSSAFGSVIGDRVERVRFMVSLDMCAFVCQAALAVVAALSGPVVLVLLLAGLTSIAASSYDPTTRATLPAVVGEDHLAAANSVQAAVENLAVVAGPGVGALLLLTGSPSLVFAVNAASFGLSALVVSFLRTRSRAAPEQAADARPLQQLFAGVRAFAESGAVRLLAGFSILASFVYGTDTVLWVVLSKQQLGTGSTGYGYLLAATGLGGVVIALFMNRIAAGRRLGLIITMGMAVYCLPTAAMALVHSPALAAVLQFVRGGGTIVVDVLAITALQRFVRPDVMARAFGVFFAFVLTAISLGALVTPFLLAWLGLTTTLLLMGFAIPVLVALAYPRVHQLDAQAQRALTSIEPVLAAISQLDIFVGATRAALESLARSTRQEVVNAGTLIVREGEPADDFFVLVAGRVEVLASGPARVQNSLGFLEPPNYFGEIGLLEHRLRTATVRAVSECTLYRIPGAVFLDALMNGALTPGALGTAKMRLARTHPTQPLTFGAGATGS